MDGNGSAATAETRPAGYELRARELVGRAFSPDQDAPPEGWVRPLAVLCGAMVYALLDIARAIREHRPTA